VPLHKLGQEGTRHAAGGGRKEQRGRRQRSPAGSCLQHPQSLIDSASRSGRTLYPILSMRWRSTSGATPGSTYGAKTHMQDRAKIKAQARCKRG